MKPHPTAQLFWDVWLGMSALSGAAFIVSLLGWLPGLWGPVVQEPALGWMEALAVAFVLVEIPAAIWNPSYTLSWRVWDIGPWAQWSLWAWLGALGGLLVAHTHLWPDPPPMVRAAGQVTPLPYVIASLVWVGLAGWLVGHFPGRGEIV